MMRRWQVAVIAVAVATVWSATAAASDVDPALAGGQLGAAANRVAFVVRTDGLADAVGEAIDVFLAHDMTATLFVSKPAALNGATREQLQRAAALGFSIGLVPDAGDLDAQVSALAATVEVPIGLVLVRGDADAARATHAGLTPVRATMVTRPAMVSRGGVVQLPLAAAAIRAAVKAVEAYNCQGAHAALLPAPLHVFVRDRKPPAEVAESIEAYRELIPSICRGPQPEPWPPHRRNECLDNPLAAGCGQ